MHATMIIDDVGCLCHRLLFPLPAGQMQGKVDRCMTIMLDCRCVMYCHNDTTENHAGPAIQSVPLFATEWLSLMQCCAKAWCTCKVDARVQEMSK